MCARAHTCVCVCVCVCLCVCVCVSLLSAPKFSAPPRAYARFYSTPRAGLMPRQPRPPTGRVGDAGLGRGVRRAAQLPAAHHSLVHGAGGWHHGAS